MTPSLEKLIGKFSSLPGIGRKSAVRLAYHVLSMPEDEARDFAEAITAAKKSVTLCPDCQIFSEGGRCGICSDPTRDRAVICVVEDTRSAEAIEELHEYHGLYHVLHGVISPMDGIGPDRLKIKELLSRLDGSVKEIIIATNPSVEGEAPAMYLSRIIKPLGLKVTRPALGLPVGATLEYADGVTLLKALEGRTEY